MLNHVLLGNLLIYTLEGVFVKTLMMYRSVSMLLSVYSFHG